jgi:hypothetical protein
MRRIAWLTAAAALAVYAAALPLHAADFSLEKISLNGYGGWYYGKSGNENQFVGATEDGSYHTADVHLSIAADVSEKLRVVTQVGWLDNEEGSEGDFDYMFAEWKLNPSLRVRLGKAKMPFGIYSEFPEVGTLRPFLVLPQAAYGPIGFLGESYKGVGFTGSFGGSWKADWDLYGGGTELTENIAGEAFLLGEELAPGAEIESEVTRGVVGGRMVVETPLPGLSVGGSFVTGTEKLEVDRRRVVYGVQAEYVGDALTVRTETMHEDVVDDLHATGSYLEVAYHLNDHWQVAAEAGRLRTRFFGAVPTGDTAGLTRHDEVGVGVSYWFSSNLVVKVNYLRVRGNAFAQPAVEDLTGIATAGQLSSPTGVLLAGAQFSF